MADFVHLHVHSQYSLLDGLSRAKELAARTAHLGQPAVALTDHGVMYGVVEFYRACKAAGVNPIIGMEMYLSPRRMTDRQVKKDRRTSHLVLLAENDTGYQNLIKIATAGQLEGFYYKPRVDKPFLAEHAEGLICLSGCGSGEISRLLLNGQMKKARQVAAWYRDVFGPERFYLEIQRHEGYPELEKVLAGMVGLNREMGIPLVATNDVHYVLPEHAHAQALLLAIQSNTTVLDPQRMKMEGESFYLKSSDEMARLFHDLPEAIENTVRIAERCGVDLDPKGYHLPDFEVPAGHDARSYLRHLCKEGLKKRYPEITPQVQGRLEHELNIIHQMGFDTYFLINWDLIRHAAERDIWWNVRGSGAGSIVAYSLGLTRLDPLAYDLIFERFLNPSRVTMPDIDLDFPDDQREEMIEYTVEKYGHDKVAQIITFGTMGARAAIRDVGRALDLPLGEVDRVAKLIPFGPKVKIQDGLDGVAELREMYENTEYIRQLIDDAQSLEGIARHASTHAAGVIVADKPLVEYAPLHRPTKSGGGVMAQFDMEILESIGLLKVDFLGLSTLTIMRIACELIEERHGIALDQDTIPIDDPAIYDLLSSGQVMGVFQVESSGMRNVLTSMRPSRFEHVIAAIALYRPGPMQFIDEYIACMHGRRQPQFAHPSLEPILGPTYGICVYQEQIIQMLTKVAGYSAGEADLVRRAVGKKKEKELVKHRSTFIEGAMKTSGLDRAAAEDIFDAIEYFANYGFNKAHSADYAIITCQTAYLKAKYPVEYMTALLTVEQHNTEKVGLLVAECRRMGIAVLPPDVNQSCQDFTIEETDGGPALSGIEGSAIRFGLGAIKNVGSGPVEAIIEAREKGGPFQSLDDFCRRTDLRRVNRRALECLIKVGSLDRFGGRAALLAGMDQMIGVSQTTHRARDVGQMSMFDVMEGSMGVAAAIELPPIPDPPRKEMLDWEKELLGLYLSEHPLQQVLENLEGTVTFSGEIDESMNGRRLALAGVVSWVREILTKRGDPMAFVGLEDLQGAIELVVFPRTYEKVRHLLQADKLLLVRGKVDAKGREPKILCDEVSDHLTLNRPAKLRPEPRPAPRRQHLLVTFQRSDDQEQDKHRLKEIYALLENYKGDDRFSFVVSGPNGKVQLDFPNASTRYCPDLKRALDPLLGSGSLRVRPLN
jgi:DNA polymerase-3 subunit alpha